MASMESHGYTVVEDKGGASSEHDGCAADVTRGDGDPSSSANGVLLIQSLLESQQQTAVERFAQKHDRLDFPIQQKRYRDLIPTGPPGEGEQFAFEVDLDACSGCKTCVSACHSLNGLSEGETWRNVGLLHGGTSELPVIQHVTTACHHCIEPACLAGCPVEAYEKDPVTGIVRHLDDQCIGCQYCILKCPYDVPKYHAAKGIVRKCDMCHDRLAVGEAPACVQSCPHEAIKINIVNQENMVAESEANVFLPGSPEPSYTLPTTAYKTTRPYPRNVISADHYSARKQHAHWPLIIMLVLTQMSVGAFVIEQILSVIVDWKASESLAEVRSYHLVAALLLGLVGMNAAVFHLGRPQFAYRAWIGLRTSWLSREMLGFGMFAALASAYVFSAFLPLIGTNLDERVVSCLGASAAAAGVLGIFCSVMIYVDTRREFWSSTYTAFKFLGTALVLGLPVSLLIALGTALISDGISFDQIMYRYGVKICQAIVVVVGIKLVFELEILTHLRKRSFTSLKRTAQLMVTELKPIMLQRFLFGVLGGIVLPGVLLVQNSVSEASQSTDVIIGVVALLMLAFLVVGEVMERYLFFTAVVAPKMPGVPAA